jgi:hypothetical protein
MTSTTSRFLCSLLMSATLGACSPTALKPEHHELRPVAHDFSLVAPALPQVVAALGMQVAQQSSGPDTITVTAITTEGVRVQITLRPSGLSSSNLDVQGEAEQQVLAQLATRLAEALADQVEQQKLDPQQEHLTELGYIASDSEPPESHR